MIRILPQDVVNQIAAGEVVERPASVLKELIENSIDAGATEIKVYIKEFGTEKIQIVDNGSGIQKADFERVFLKHATSKLQQIEDLNSLHSFGFRGEALASISSVSRVILQTKHASDEVGSEVLYDGGAIKSIKPCATIKGTDIQILDLFHNVPARKKFLKAKATENKALVDMFNKFVLANPDVAFYIDIDGSSKSYPVESLKSRAAKILKVDDHSLIEVFYDGLNKVSGFVIHPRVFLKSKSSQFTYVNKRPVSDATIYKAVVDGFDTFMMKNQIPGFLVFVNVPPQLVDVNVHPRKTEIRFANPSEIYKSVRTAVNVNLVKTLREETQKKLNIKPEIVAKAVEKPVETVQEVNTPYPAKQVQTKVESLAQEFEEFLLAGDKHAEIREEVVSEEIPAFLKTRPVQEATVTEQAMLFNKEVIEQKDEHRIYLDFANATQLLDSYIVTSNGKDILIVDQHAASERYFYEKYLNQLKNKKVNSKLLLFPEIVILGEFEKKSIEEQKPLFEELGFDFEPFGDEELKFSKVPDFVKMDNFQNLIHRIVKDILEHGEITNVRHAILHEIAAILACHTAVRFGDKLSREEIISILKNLSTCEDPYNCPHGRPVIQEFSKYDIEKKFKRCGL